MTRKKQGNNETGHSRHAYRYTAISQVPASTILTIRKALSGGWVDRMYNGNISTVRINRMYNDISPKCMQEIIRTYKDEIVANDGE